MYGKSKAIQSIRILTCILVFFYISTYHRKHSLAPAFHIKWKNIPLVFYLWVDTIHNSDNIWLNLKRALLEPFIKKGWESIVTQVNMIHELLANIFLEKFHRNCSNPSLCIYYWLYQKQKWWEIDYTALLRLLLLKYGCCWLVYPLDRQKHVRKAIYLLRKKGPLLKCAWKITLMQFSVSPQRLSVLLLEAYVHTHIHNNQ